MELRPERHRTIGTDALSTQAARLPDAARTVLIAVNPKAGSGPAGQKIEHLRQLLQADEFHVETHTTLDDLAVSVAQAQAAGTLRTVVAAGGDGTVAELVNRTKPGVPLAVLPLGTENLLARYLGQPRTAEATAEAITGGVTVPLDAGRANGRLFMLMVSAGFDAEVARRLHAARTGHITRLSWIKPIWDTIRSYNYPELRVYCRGEPAREGSDPVDAYRCRWAFGVNLPRYALGLQMVPAAVATDGLLDVCLLRRGSLPHGLRYLAGVMLGRHARFADCTMTQCRSLRIEADAPVPYQIDGDPGGWLPVDVEMLPARVTLVVSSRTAHSLGFHTSGLQTPSGSPEACPGERGHGTQAQFK